MVDGDYGGGWWMEMLVMYGDYGGGWMRLWCIVAVVVYGSDGGALFVLADMV